jgi:hypothetical protein
MKYSFDCTLIKLFSARQGTFFAKTRPSFYKALSLANAV